jgi:hypothetical protein
MTDTNNVEQLRRERNESIRNAVALEAEVATLRAALEKIRDGNWNFGNSKPGMFVTQFAAATLAGKGEA